MARRALIDSNNTVVNVVELDADATSFDGYTAVDGVGASPGDVYDPDTGSFSTPLPPLDERKTDMRGQAREQFKTTLASGFNDGSGTVWAATDDARARVLDLTQRIQEYRAGKVASALPNGKSTVKLRDASNTAHDVGPDKITSLAEQGSDFKDQAEDRLEQLVADIDTATSHSDLDALDVTAGWP